MRHVASKSSHPTGGNEVNFNWDDIRIFLKLARLGSIRAVAAATGHSAKALRSRIMDLEAQTGAVLFHRSAAGVSLTKTGERLIAAAEEIQKQAKVFGALSMRGRRDLKPTARVGITEGLGAFWLTPMFGNLRRAHPDIQFDMKCSMTAPNISELEVDLAIQLDKPTDPNLIVRRIGYLHVVLYAAQSYVDEYGAPATKADIADYHFVEIEAPQIRSERVEEEMTREDKRRFVNMRVNISSAQFVAALSGWGVTALPTYAPIVSSGLVHVAKDFVLRRDIWLAYHPQAAELRHIRQTIDWIVQSFDASLYPWFREEFVSPAEIEHYMERKKIMSFFTPGAVARLAS
ncbi:LysR family transcriptional regulator [Bosea sp. 685]|uniref:LysR family transcriptional regulator n=1 Tax=Bosea sp. 685 TaxID=3080057 RepID=UPI002893345D|nr:LysR family transcriptional regulator [Bosea sp. 685]WNJ89793.1 LysR family transcriptional regulator [Bosea sp. 685]